MLQFLRNEDRKERNVKDITEEEWGKVIHLFRGNKRKREESRKEV